MHVLVACVKHEREGSKTDKKSVHVDSGYMYRYFSF